MASRAMSLSAVSLALQSDENSKSMREDPDEFPNTYTLHDGEE